MELGGANLYARDNVGDERKTVKEIKYRTKNLEEKIWKQQAVVQG